MKKIYFIISVLLFLLSDITKSQAQETVFDETSVVYQHQIYGGIFAHTNGFGVHVTKGKNVTAFKSRLLQLDILSMRHSKEIKTYNPFYSEGRSYVYGKLNSFFIIRPSFGYKIIKYDKIRESGVEVGYSWRIGPSFGFTKPVYLEMRPSQEPGTYTTVERASAETFTNISDIVGRASGLKGFDEIKVHPGAFASFAVNFETSPEKEGIKGIEVGAILEYYPTGPIEILHLAKNHSIFFNFYICLQIGKKYNK